MPRTQLERQQLLQENLLSNRLWMIAGRVKADEMGLTVTYYHCLNSIYTTTFQWQILSLPFISSSTWRAQRLLVDSEVEGTYAVRLFVMVSNLYCISVPNCSRCSEQVVLHVFACWLPARSPWRRCPFSRTRIFTFSRRCILDGQNEYSVWTEWKYIRDCVKLGVMVACPIPQ